MKFPNFLRIAIVANVGLFQINSSEDSGIKVIGGLEYRFLQALSEALNFTYEIHVPNDGEWGINLGNRHWTGVLGLLFRNEVDIAISKIFISHERSTVVDFSYPYAIGRTMFATAPPDVRSKEMAIFFPFTKEVWIAISLTAVLVVFVFRLIFRKFNYRRIISHIFGSLLNSSGGVKSKKLREMILNSAWLFGSMILSYSFSAVLLSFLTVPQKEPAINDKNSLSEVVEKGLYKCYTVRGSYMLRILEKSANEHVVSLAKHIVKNDWFVSPTGNDISRTLLRPKTAVILPESSLDIRLSDSVFVAPDYFNLVFEGIAVNKNFCCKNKIDSFIHRFVAGGMYDKLIRDFQFPLKLKYRKFSSESGDFTPLTLQDIIGAFVVLACGYFLSCVSLVFELIIAYMMYDSPKSKSGKNRCRIK